MKAVVDTNVFVRAVIRPQGTVGPVILRLRAGAYRLITSQPILEELVDVLARPRIRRKYGVTEAMVAILLDLIALRGLEVRPERAIRACRDPDDDIFLEAAVAGGADFLVTGDGDLLDLDPFETVRIVRPAEFLERLSA